MTLHKNPSGWLWRVEVGPRAALHTETMPRDMRWWRGWWDRTKWRR